MAKFALKLDNFILRPNILILPKYFPVTENNPLLVDDTRLAEHFIDKLNLILTPSTHLERTFQYSCSIDILNAKHIFFLTKLLDLKLFSQSVTLDLENITEDLREAPTAQNTCRKLLPFIQCFMYYRPEFKGVYQYFSQRAIQSNKGIKIYFIIK